MASSKLSLTSLLFLLCLVLSLECLRSVDAGKDDGNDSDCRFIGPCIDQDDCSKECVTNDYDPHGALCVPNPDQLSCCCIVHGN